MDRELSHRLAPVRQYGPFVDMSVADWHAFLGRALKVGTFGGLSAADRELIIAAEAKMSPMMRSRWRVLEGKVKEAEIILE